MRQATRTMWRSAWPCEMLCQHGTVRLLWMCSISLDLLTSKCCPTSLRRLGGPRESWLTSDQKTENDSTIICIGGTTKDHKSTHKTCMETFDDEWLRGWMVWLCICPLVEDPEASSNDRFVALELLKNACVAWTYREPVGYWMACLGHRVIECPAVTNYGKARNILANSWQLIMSSSPACWPSKRIFEVSEKRSWSWFYKNRIRRVFAGCFVNQGSSQKT